MSKHIESLSARIAVMPENHPHKDIALAALRLGDEAHAKRTLDTLDANPLDETRAIVAAKNALLNDARDAQVMPCLVAKVRAMRDPSKDEIRTHIDQLVSVDCSIDLRLVRDPDTFELVAPFPGSWRVLRDGMVGYASRLAVSWAAPQLRDLPIEQRRRALLEAALAKK